MHDPQTLIYGCRFFDLWHVDPCNKGRGDDSCGFFLRAHHGDAKVLETIRKELEFDWDRIWSPSKEDHDEEDGEFKPKTYFCGLFKPGGDPALSVHGIVVNLFFTASLKVFGTRRKALKYLNRHLFEILFFAENPTDSLYNGITRKFEIGCGEAHTPQRRAERIERMASCIYAYILRDIRPWWKHPRWHVHHWKLNVHFWSRLLRWAFSRCNKCGGHFGFGETPVSMNWNPRGPKLFSGEPDVTHERCSQFKSG